MERLSCPKYEWTITQQTSFSRGRCTARLQCICTHFVLLHKATHTHTLSIFTFIKKADKTLFVRKGQSTVNRPSVPKAGSLSLLSLSSPSLSLPLPPSPSLSLPPPPSPSPPLSLSLSCCSKLTVSLDLMGSEYIHYNVSSVCLGYGWVGYITFLFFQLS